MSVPLLSHGFVRRVFLHVLALCCLCGLTSCATSSTTAATSGTAGTPTASSIWVATWGASPENALPTAVNPGGAEKTYRFFLLPTTAGQQERVHFSNLMGTTPVTIGRARLAVGISHGPAIDSMRDLPIFFSGSPTVTLAAGQEIVSDPINVTYSFGERLAVTVYVKGSFGPLTQHDSQVTTNYAATQAGDFTADTAGSAFANPITEWFMLTGVDVYGPYQGTVAYFGSSSVDGHGSNYSSANAYPVVNVPVPNQDDQRPSDWLAKQLVAAGYNIGVLNAGTIGDPAGEDARTSTGAALAGVDRLNHDVLQQSNVKAVVIYIGGVDIRGDCAMAANVEASLTNMVTQAHAANIRVILGTIPPAEYCLTLGPETRPDFANPWQGDVKPGPENPGSVQRRALNDWIRTTGSQLPGVVAIADFEGALAYPAHPDFLIPNYTSSDNFHPTGEGYRVQSAAIPLKAILGQ